MLLNVVLFWPHKFSTSNYLLDNQTCSERYKRRKGKLFYRPGKAGFVEDVFYLCSNKFRVIFATSLKICFAPTVFYLNNDFEKYE